MLRNTLMSTSDAIMLFDVGAGQVQGSRKTQEDRYTICLPEHFHAKTDDNLAFFAIYDGHGSDLVADHASKNLHNLLAQRPELQRRDYAAAMKAALADEDGVLLDTFMRETVEPAVSGSTVAVCLINLTAGELVVSNLGDSHVILAERDPKTEYPYHIRRLTATHKPEVPSERDRINKAGGTVEKRNGTTRLVKTGTVSWSGLILTGETDGVGSLNMSRALGDLQYKNPENAMKDPNSTTRERRASSSSTSVRGDFLSNDPYTSRRQLQSNRRYLLVIVSDGVSDRIDDTALIQHMMKLSMRGMRANDIAQEVVSSTASRPRSDNATCVVAMLDGQHA
ncbi:Protein phosphatase [Penicillium rolfsii]|nr:Protein phosphatase [Penicillium rolfsii]